MLHVFQYSVALHASIISRSFSCSCSYHHLAGWHPVTCHLHGSAYGPPTCSDMTSVDITARRREDWLSSSVINHTVVNDPTHFTFTFSSLITVVTLMRSTGVISAVIAFEIRAGCGSLALTLLVYVLLYCIIVYHCKKLGYISSF